MVPHGEGVIEQAPGELRCIDSGRKYGHNAVARAAEAIYTHSCSHLGSGCRFVWPQRRAMDKRMGTTARPIGRARLDTRMPSRAVDDTIHGEHMEQVGEPQRLSAGTKSALVHAARRKASVDRAEAKARGRFLMKSTLGAVTTYTYVGDSGPSQPVLQVVDESYHRSHAKDTSKGSSSHSQAKAASKSSSSRDTV